MKLFLFNFFFLRQCRCKVLHKRFEVSLFRNFLVGNCIVQYVCHKLIVCPVIEAFRTDSSYFLHGRIVFDVKQSWECVPLPYLDSEYSKISWFSFIFSVLCSQKQRFFSLFVCFGCGNGVSGYFLSFWVLKTSCLMSFVCLRDEDDVSSCF